MNRTINNLYGILEIGFESFLVVGKYKKSRFVYKQQNEFVTNYKFIKLVSC